MKSPAAPLFIAALFLLAACSSSPSYDASGIFEATTVTLSAETSGKILMLDAEEGDTVAAGAPVAVVDTTILALQLRQLESRKLSTITRSPDIAAQAASLRTQIAHQEQEVARISRLLADGAATSKQYDDATAALATLRAQLSAQLSSLGKSSSSISDDAVAMQYEKEQIAQQIVRSTVVSPITATVLVKYAEPGEFAVPGRQLVKIADLGHIYLRAYFTALQLATIRLGQEVTVTADFGGDELYDYPGTITWISEESEFTPKSIQTQDSRANLVYAVKVAVENDGRLKLGQYGHVTL